VRINKNVTKFLTTYKFLKNGVHHLLGNFTSFLNI